MQYVEKRTDHDRERGKQVTLDLLGQFSAYRSGQPISLSSRKAKGMLAYLALAPGCKASREILADLLWTNRGSDQARGSLRHAIKELRDRSEFADILVARRDTVGLSQSLFETDFHSIISSARDRDLPSLAALLESAQGDLLEDLTGLASAFDDWLLPERARSRERIFADTLDALRECGAGDMKHAREILRSLGRIEPTDEAAARIGMRLDHASGDTSSLHRRYRDLSNKLRSEFDVHPSARTRELFRELTSPGALSDSEDTPAPKSQASSVRQAFEPLVLVSPLHAHGQEHEVASFGAACGDDIRTAICQLRGLSVLSLEEADHDTAIRAGDDALAIYYLTGSIRRIGQGYQVALQLANAASQLILWAETFRFENIGIDALDTLVERASGVILPAIDRDLWQSPELGEGELTSDAAKYTRSRLLIRQVGNLAAIEEAVRLLEDVVEADPDHVGARLLLCRMYNTDFWQQLCGHDVEGFRRAAREHLAAVIRQQPGQIEIRLRQAWDELRRANTQRALSIFRDVEPYLPNDPDLVNLCAFGMCHLGEFEIAEKLMQRAFRQNPFPPSDYHADYAVLCALRGQAEDAEDYFTVSGEQGMQYMAVRLANAERLKDAETRIDDLPLQFARAFRAAWQRDDDPQLDDVLGWVDYTLPLHPLPNREFVKLGLQDSLKDVW